MKATRPQNSRFARELGAKYRIFKDTVIELVEQVKARQVIESVA